MTDNVETLATATAAFASILGIVVALNQFLLPARLRRMEQWARDAGAGEPDPSRAANLQAVRRWGSARLLGGVHVPARNFVEGVAWVCFAPIVIVAMLTDDEDLVWPLVGVVLVAAWLPARRAVRAYLERQRLARQFMNGEDLDAPKLGLLDSAEGHARTEFVVAFFIALGACLLGLGIALFLNGERGTWFLGAVFAAASCMWFSYSWLSARAVRVPSSSC